MTVADRIGVMNAGRLEQVATPRQLYEAPATRWVAEFVGDVNMLEGRIARRDGGRLVVATTTAGEVIVAEPPQPSAAEQVCVAIRPEKIRLSLRGPADEAVQAGALPAVPAPVTQPPSNRASATGAAPRTIN